MAESKALNMGLKSGAEYVPVLEDLLYHVHLNNRELMPIYWDGPVLEVRRGIWFETKGSGIFSPCDEQLGNCLEDLYLVFII